MVLEKRGPMATYSSNRSMSSRMTIDIGDYTTEHESLQNLELLGHTMRASPAQQDAEGYDSQKMKGFYKFKKFRPSVVKSLARCTVRIG